ncbi:MAG: carboxy terminal-processing peptidase [Verrucomicrobiota bacterium]
MLALVVAHLAPAEDGVFEASGLMRAETRWLVNSLERLHFSEIALEDLEMSELIVAFMEDLDYNHLYFTAGDRDGFLSRFSPPMVRYLRSGNLHPAFQVFSVFQSRVKERIAWVREYLDQDFEFNEGLVYKTDRSEESWPASNEEVDELWRTRIQYELLNELIPLMAPNSDDSLDLEDGVSEADVETGEPLPFEEALAEAKEIVAQRYLRLEREMNRFEAAEVQEIFLTTLARTYDPHSLYLSADSLEDLSIAIENSLVGIGAVLTDVDGYCTVRELIPGGPAGLSNQIHVDDQILGVAQGEDGEYVDVVGMKLRKIVKMIRGEKESVVRLNIRPAEAADPSERKEVVLVRDEVQLTANLARAKLYQIPVDGRTVPIGVINLPSFYGSELPDHPNSSDDVAELIVKMKAKGVEGIILDLRENGGGLLSEAVELAGLFIPEGPVVQVKTVQGDLMHHDDSDSGIVWEGPLLVLVSKFTASASEIVAGALQNYERALVVGDSSTHGKGTVQGIFRMTPPLFYSLSASGQNVGATKLTVQKYYLPNGESTQVEGVKADLVIPSMSDFLSMGEADLDHSLPWDTITPLSFGLKQEDQLDLILVQEGLIDSLRELSGDRVDTLEEFSVMAESIDFFRERREQKEVSLDLEERRRQQESDQSLREYFNEKRESLSENAYDFELFVLDAETETVEASVVEEDKDGPPLDVVLREGIRIMSDWLSVIDNDSSLPRAAVAQKDLGVTKS